MNRRNSLLIAIVGVCLSGLLSSCASTRVTGGWKVPSVARVAPRRVLVLAVLGNTTSRRAVEDEVVRQLGQAGVIATLGYRISPDTGDLPPRRLAQALADCGAEAALVCRWQRLRQTAPARAGSTSGSPSGDRGQLLACGDATLLGGPTLGTLWFAETLSDRSGGFREAAPAFAEALVSAILSDGALSCDGHLALPANGDAGVAVCSCATP
jgi:hypothetical protein